jgi:hypothetical protein
MPHMGWSQMASESITIKFWLFHFWLANIYFLFKTFETHVICTHLQNHFHFMWLWHEIISSKIKMVTIYLFALLVVTRLLKMVVSVHFKQRPICSWFVCYFFWIKFFDTSPFCVHNYSLDACIILSTSLKSW